MRHIAECIARNHRLFPEAPGVADATRRLSHGQLAERAWAIGRGLRAIGVQTGDSVGVLSGNTVFSAETFLGVVAAGAAYVPYIWRWTTDELVHGINETGAKVVLVAQGFEEAIQAAIDSRQLERDLVVIVEGPQLEAFVRPGGPLDIDYDPEDTACVLFTGGTTGFSKGVMLSSRACLSNAYQEITDCRVGATPGDRCVISTPMFHSAALLCWFMPHYVMASFCFIAKRFDEAEIAEIVDREGITNMFLVPNMIRRMLNAGAFETQGFKRTFRALHTGAGLLRLPDKLAMLDAIPDLDLYFRYGLTEAGPQVSRLQPVDILREDIDGSIGKEYINAEVELRAEDGLTSVGTDEIGEIYVRGTGLMTGYYGRPEATEAVMSGGWLKTGDMASRNRDGYLFFRDRAKDMIKSGGENVYSSEIEQLLHTHGAVMEAAVLGVPSLEWDEEVRAVISIREGQSVSEDELKAFMRERLAGYKIPKVIILVGPGALPVNPSGKILKTEVRKMMGW